MRVDVSLPRVSVRREPRVQQKNGNNTYTESKGAVCMSFVGSGQMYKEAGREGSSQKDGEMDGGRWRNEG